MIFSAGGLIRLACFPRAARAIAVVRGLKPLVGRHPFDKPVHPIHHAVDINACVIVIGRRRRMIAGLKEQGNLGIALTRLLGEFVVGIVEDDNLQCDLRSAGGQLQAVIHLIPIRQHSA